MVGAAIRLHRADTRAALGWVPQIPAFNLVQVWAYSRFLTIKSKPIPRLALCFHAGAVISCERAGDPQTGLPGRDGTCSSIKPTGVNLPFELALCRGAPSLTQTMRKLFGTAEPWLERFGEAGYSCGNHF